MNENEAVNYIKQAFELREQKYYKPAIEMLYKALEIENDNTEILYQIGDLYFVMNNYERALQYLEKALSTNSNHQPCLKLICKIKKRTGDYDTALSIAQKLFENDKNSKNLKRLITLLIELKLFTELDQYENDPCFDDEARIECANAFYSNGETGKAKEFLQQCNHDNEQVLLLEGKIKFDQGDFEGSKGIFNRISSNSQDPEILNFLGLFDIENMNFTDAIRHFAAASELDKNNPKYFYNLGNAYFYNGWIKEAQQAYSKAIYLNPDNADYRYSLAYLYYETKDYSKSEAETEAILGIDSEHAGTLVLNALLLAHNKKYIESVELLKNCIEKNPSDDFAQKSLSSIYTELGNYEKAQKILEKTESVLQKKSSSLCDLAEIYILQKEYDKAINLVNEIIDNNENYISAYILGAKASYLKQDYNKTKEYAQNILSLDINCASGYYYLALSRQNTNDPEEAIECMKRAILYDLNNPEYYAQMSDLYLAQNDYKTALEYMSEAQNLDKSNKYKSKFTELVKLNRKKS